MTTDRPRWTVDEAVAKVDGAWRRMAVEPRDRAALAGDLRLDLDAARDEGVSPGDLIGPDVTGFARRLADEAGARRIPYESQRLILTGLLGALPGAAVGYLALNVFYVGLLVGDPVEPTPFTTVASYAVWAAIVVAGILVTVRWLMRDVPRIGRTVAAMALLVPVAGAVATPVTMGFAALVGYRTLPPIVMIEAGIVALALAGACLLARRWALRGYTAVPAH